MARAPTLAHMFVDNAPVDLVLRAGLLSVIALLWVSFVVRVIGLRTFSKMTAFDFVATVATGSLLAGATQATDWPGFLQPTLAIAALLGAQYAISRLRQAGTGVVAVLENAPALLMRDGVYIDDALRRTRVTKSDIRATQREANVTDFSQVRAVVLETTGDISVLHGHRLSDDLLTDVEG